MLYEVITLLDRLDGDAALVLVVAPEADIAVDLGDHRVVLRITSYNVCYTKLLRRNLQVVFQDPYGTFDPRWRVQNLIAENLHLNDEPLTAGETRMKVDEMLDQVGLASADAERFPHEFSGGQRQRIAIARALITDPS